MRWPVLPGTRMHGLLRECCMQGWRQRQRQQMLLLHVRWWRLHACLRRLHAAPRCCVRGFFVLIRMLQSRSSFSQRNDGTEQSRRGLMQQELLHSYPTHSPLQGWLQAGPATGPDASPERI
jgi:hypothetical protein